MIVLDILFILFIIFIGLNFNNRFEGLNQYDKVLLKKIFYFHFFFGLIFFAYVSKFGGDSTNYWFVTYFDFFELEDVLFMIKSGSATGYMLLLNYIPAKLLGLSFLTGTLFYSLLGYMGFVYFYLILKEQVPNWDKLKSTKILGFSVFPMLFFMPNLHFWSAAVGKDTLMFFSIGLFVYSLRNIKKNSIGIVIAILLTVFIRPHITLFMVSALGLGYLFDGKLSSFQKTFMILTFSIGFILLLSTVQKFANIESLETDAIEAYGNTQISNLSATRVGSAVDTSNYPLPLKVFTFLFRPLFFDGFSPMNIIASFENLFLLLFFVKVLRNKPLEAFKVADNKFKGFFFLFIFGSIAFSMILGNLGIMMRQKTPFIMVFILFGFYVINHKLDKSRII